MLWVWKNLLIPMSLPPAYFKGGVDLSPIIVEYIGSGQSYAGGWKNLISQENL
jgi:hypothetical protein